MSTETVSTAEAKRELAAVIDKLANSARDPNAVRKARERMDQMREDLRQRIGTVQVAVDLVRDARDP